jgi:hypothetical protein
MAIQRLCGRCAAPDLGVFLEEFMQGMKGMGISEPEAMPHVREIPHCYGTGGHTIPGVMGGWTCPCECGNWEKP